MHQQIFRILNCWNANIKLTHDDSECSHATSFLDLRIVSTDNGVSYSTFRKPLNAYCYLPFSSNHSLATKAGIISTELRRLFVKNLHEHDFNAQSQLFTQKLLDRGFPIDLIRKISARINLAEKATILSQSSDNSQKRVVPFKLTYCKGIQKLCISSSLHFFNDLLPHSFTDRYRLVISYQSAPNLFRLRYSRFV